MMLTIKCNDQQYINVSYLMIQCKILIYQYLITTSVLQQWEIYRVMIAFISHLCANLHSIIITIYNVFACGPT